ncbi:MAG: DUF736 domain-containing protein [Rhodospirillales bacterium]|jgi:uncharacterized protein (DUF736 family)|nr:DUF736 domain-containing protein [Rhodospirillales bacterium]
MKIGNFTKKGDKFTGTIETLSINKKVTVEATENPTENAPIFQIMAGKSNIGAIWEKQKRESTDTYLSVKLDDPCYAAPIYGVLHPTSAADYDLIWDGHKSKTA